VHPSRINKLVFLSSCPEPWGGSEELWYGTALQFASSGHQISVVKTLIDPSHANIRVLQQACRSVDDYYDQYQVPRLLRLARRVLPHRWLPPTPDFGYEWLCKYLHRLKPDLVVVSQGENFDGLHFVNACHQGNVAYVLISQKATDSKWPCAETRSVMRRAYAGAERAYFVSNHNLELTQCQMGLRLSNAEIVRNPFLTPVSEALPWPDTADGVFKLACVARLFIMEKGQDVLLRVLAQEKWKQRPIEVNFFGVGMHLEALKGMASFLGLDNVRFAGFTSEISDVWREHHALVLPSRCEGLPLSLVEAMLCGRFGIVTDVGGTAEIVDDNESGFVAQAATVQSFDEAMERAWQQRHQWQHIGRQAAASVRTYVPADPCATFADKLRELLK